MTNANEESANLNLLLAVCWIFGVVLAVIVTMYNEKLQPAGDEVLRWIVQILVPICLLVLSRVLKQKITTKFEALQSRRVVFWLALTLSVVFIGFAIRTIFAAANANPSAIPESVNPKYKLLQLEALSNLGTTILVAVIWPILSMLLDYLFPKDNPASPSPDNPLGKT